MTICETKSCNENKKAIEALQKKVEELEAIIQEMKCPQEIVIGGTYVRHLPTLDETEWVVMDVAGEYVLMFGVRTGAMLREKVGNFKERFCVKKESEIDES